MAPEQRDRPASVDHRADIFSLGVVLYEMLTGELPGSKLQPPSKKVQIDVRLDEIVLRALDTKPELRFHTATEFRQQVEGVVNTPPPTRVCDEASVAQGISRSIRCHVTTPQQLATFFGQFFFFWRNWGQLVLDDRQLTITRGASVVAIPLAAIRDMGIGLYPVLVSVLGIRFLSVTYETNGKLETLYFSPHEAGVGVPNRFDESVAISTWFDAIRQRVIATTGQAPIQSPVHEIGLPQNFRSVVTWAVLLMLVVVAIAVRILIFGNPQPISVGGASPHHFWFPALIIAMPMLFVVMFISIGFLRRAKIRRYIATTDDLNGTLTGIGSMDRAASSTTDTSPASLTVADALGFRTLWGKRLFQLSHLGFLGFLCFLSFVPGLERAMGFSGFFGFFGFVGFAVMVEHWHRRGDQTSLGLASDVRSQRHKIAFAASVVWLVTGLVVGTVRLRATEVSFRYDLEWLALTLFLLATAVLPGVLVSKSIKQWCEKRDPLGRSSLFGWLRTIAVLGFVMTLPFVMFTTGLLDGLVSQVLAWEGAMFAMLVPIGLIGFIALPWASVVLWQARFLLTAATGDPQVADARQRQHRRLVTGTIVAMLIAVWLVINVPTRPQPAEVTTRHATVENGHYTFEYSVQNVPGWNVWLTLENAQLINSDSPHLEDRGPVVISRYQAKLVGNGRVRVPLEYLPTTDEGLGKMRASIDPFEGDRIQLRPRQNFSKLAYQTESLMRVWAILMMLPEGQTPDSQLIEPTGSPITPRYKTIEPPAQPKLGPFEGTYEQGRVELFALSDHPSIGESHWKPNGEPLTEAVPEFSRSISPTGRVRAGKVMKTIIVRVHNATKTSAALMLRIQENSGCSLERTWSHYPDAKHQFASHHGEIACPPQVREVTIEVRVSEGDWHKEIDFPRRDNQPYSVSTSGNPKAIAWAGSVRSASIVGDRVPLAFSYSRREEYETRMTYEREDGTIVPLVGEGSDGNADMINSLTTLPVAEFKQIKHFRVESRRYQWVEFRNVSLQLGHRTQVEVQSAGLFFPPSTKPLEVASSAKPTDQPATQAPSNATKPSDNETSNANKIDPMPIIMKLIENEQFVRGFRVKTEAKIRQRVGNDFSLPEIEREIKTSFAIDERGRIRSEQTGGVPGRIGTTDVRQQHEVAVFDGVMLRLLQGPPNEPGNWGYHGRDKYRMPREVDPRNYLLEHSNEPLRGKISGGQYRAVGKEWRELAAYIEIPKSSGVDVGKAGVLKHEVIAFESTTTTRESEKTSFRGRLLLDPSLGYAAVYRVSQIRFDDLGPKWYDFARYEVSEYKPVPSGAFVASIYVPGRAIYTSLLPNRDVIKAKQPIETAWQHDIRFLDWELNPKFTDDDFKLNFPDGIFVMDETK